jgi:hypothetical protein
VGRRLMGGVYYGAGSMLWRPRSLPNATATRAVLTGSPTHSQSSVTQAWRGTDSGTGAIVCNSRCRCQRYIAHPTGLDRQPRKLALPPVGCDAD